MAEEIKMCCLSCGGEEVMDITEDEDLEDDLLRQYMCQDCGEEQSGADWKYRGYKIGQVTEVEEMKAPLKKCKVSIGEGEEDLQIVTNAKYVAEDDWVVVATEGAIVPAGAQSEADGGQGIEVKPTSVGG